MQIIKEPIQEIIFLDLSILIQEINQNDWL